MAGLRGYLFRVFRALFIFIALGAILFTVQTLWHPLDPVIEFLNQPLDQVTSTLSSPLLAGVTLATLGLFLILLSIPLLMRGVDNRQFLTSFLRGILSAGVFLVTDYLYNTLEKMGRFYLIIGMLAAIIVTFIMVEIITRAGKEKDQVAIRTDISAAIASGLAFGLILKMGAFGLQFLPKVF